jgi:hypothetical protein
MPEVVTIAHGDTISRILKNKKGIKEHEINTWMRKLRTINPHISNFNHIFPGERVLIPSAIHEIIFDEQIWKTLSVAYHHPWSFRTMAIPSFF